MDWVSKFRCLSCGHAWFEEAPDDIWEMVRRVASLAACPLCGAKMEFGQVELLSYRERHLEVFGTCQYNFTSIHQPSD
jgi:rubredoxin